MFLDVRVEKNEARVGADVVLHSLLLFEGGGDRRRGGGGSERGKGSLRVYVNWGVTF